MWHHIPKYACILYRNTVLKKSLDFIYISFSTVKFNSLFHWNVKTKQQGAAGSLKYKFLTRANNTELTKTYPKTFVVDCVDTMVGTQNKYRVYIIYSDTTYV